MGPNIGTSLKVVGVQVVELVTGNGAVDSGTLSVEECALFGVDGFKATSLLSEAEPAATGSDDYGFDEIPLRIGGADENYFDKHAIPFLYEVRSSTT